MSPEQLGPYRIDTPLGKGGMGTVYAAQHEETGESVAIKVLSRLASSDDNLRQRFAMEIETLKKLRHRNIVQLAGHGQQDGILFFVMERVHGETLSLQLKRDGPFHWSDVVRITLEVCLALKHAHDRGVIHRDLKPANLMLSEDGTVKLADFGIAKFFGSQHLTGDHSVIGTVDYMAPEQADGQQPTVRSDLYSLGSVIYALLSGRPPFASRVVTQVLHRLKYDNPLPLSESRPEIPPELDQIVLQLLHKQPEDRIPTALALQHRLQSMQHALERQPHLPVGRTPQAPPPDTGSSPGSGSGSLANRPTREGSYTDSLPASDGTVAIHSPDGEETDVTMVAGDRVHSALQPPENHYTAVAADETGMPTSPESAQSPGLAQWIRILPLLLSLLALASGVWYFTRPPTAQVLIERIERAETDGSRSALTHALRDIELFLDHYESHPRAQSLSRLRFHIERTLAPETAPDQ